LPRENNFRLIIYTVSSANPENLAKIDAVDLKMTGLREIVKRIRNSSRSTVLLLYISRQR